MKIILAVLFSFILCGCGGGNDDFNRTSKEDCMSVQALIAAYENPWQFVGAGATFQGTNPIAYVPSGVVAGDLLVIIAGSTNAYSTPSGWTPVVANGSTGHLTMFTKIATNSESNVNLSNSGSSVATMLAYRFVGNIDVVGTVNTGLGSSLATNSLTTTQLNDLVISFWLNGFTGDGWTPPAGTIVRVNESSPGTTFGMLVVDENMATAGATTPRTAVCSSNLLAADAVSFITF